MFLQAKHLGASVPRWKGEHKWSPLIQDMKVILIILCTSDILFPFIFAGSVYVKITLISENKVMSRRKTPMAVVADKIKFYDVQKFSLQILMLENVTLVFTLYVRDSKGMSTMIGRTNVGSITYSSGTGLSHWNDMMTSTSTATEMWHDLLWPVNYTITFMVL